MNNYIDSSKIDSLIAEINPSNKMTELEIMQMEHNVAEYYKSISLNLKLYYFADAEYVKALRAFKIPNSSLLNKDLPEGLQLLYAATLKKKFEKSEKGLSTAQEDEDILKIENAIRLLKSDFDNFKADWAGFISKYGSVSEKMAKHGKDFDADLDKVKNDYKEKRKARNGKFILIALGAFYFEFIIDKLLDKFLPERWYISLISSVFIFILAYLWIDKIRENFTTNVKRQSLFSQLAYLKELTNKSEVKVNQTCKDLNITPDEYIIELSALLQKLNVYDKLANK